ncbi:DUF2911 domain-containing protein [Fulvivirga sp. M361]|uniref:DUF2911 domain-containing protein n=1 Tax=Fulvivirga sp. M361 TaxID=2594266 RepID=UPI00117A9E43|nr:DUF2911 domain-containing protein [Fulvivirga sp. M361]TRX52168.1 DUF2911 domain-containing protein [Fulvivirga sp. M361]
MKRIFIATLSLIACFAWQANGQITVPQPSPAGSVFSKVGLTNVTIDYFRPKVKGRKIFGEGSDFLQPYGTLWRAGANSGSKLTLSTDVEIAGKKVNEGEYLIFITPGKDQWEFKLYSDISIGGNVAKYDKSKEVLSTNVKATKLTSNVEALTYNITDLSEDNSTAAIEMAWADMSIKVPLKVSFDEEVMADIAKNTKVNPRNYLAAANYYLSANKDMDQALKWVNMYLAEGENSKQFWNLHLKARILAKMGNKKEAITTAEKSLDLAKNFPNGDFGYIKRNQDLIAEVKAK